MIEPHPTLASLYRKRIELRNGTRDQTMYAAHRREVMTLEVHIHEAERRHGRGVYRFRRCESCQLLHAAAMRGCDGKGRTLFELWSAWSVDLVHVVE